MKRIHTLLFLLAITIQYATAQNGAAKPPKGFSSSTAKVNGVNIHYIKGGSGKPLVLLHGFGQNWYTWNRLLPELSKHFTVVVPDLRGIGESGRPQQGYDKATMAADIHALTVLLAFDKINLAGHDIGEMVAYRYAVNYPDQVERLALLDTPIPGIEPVWTEAKAFSWWWGFNGWPASGKLIKGQEALFLNNFWPVVGHLKNAFTPLESQEFIRANAKMSDMACSFKWFAAFPDDAKLNLKQAGTKLQMPVLAMGGEFSLNELAAHVKMVAHDVTDARVPGAGHWLMQENAPFVQQAFIDFFSKP
jgi:pimeloyl-ACP methyl ester carboxylesterase